MLRSLLVTKVHNCLLFKSNISYMSVKQSFASESTGIVQWTQSGQADVHDIAPSLRISVKMNSCGVLYVDRQPV